MSRRLPFDIFDEIAINWRWDYLVWAVFFGLCIVAFWPFFGA